jgi:hypothetical protein
MSAPKLPSAAREAATAYVTAGWRLVPVPAKSKRPVDHDWPNRVYTPEQITGNVGVMLGPASGDLADADIDSHWGLKLAPYFLPDTARFGRASKPDSHWLFRCAGLRNKKFTFARGDRIELVELRAQNQSNDNGGMTVFPGSIHESGEAVEWSADCPDEIVTIDRGELIWRMTRLAVACVIADGWDEGQRNNKCRAWSGGLLQAHWTPDEVRELFAAVYDATDAEAEQRQKDLSGVERTILAYEAGTQITSFGSLVAEGLVAPAVVRRVEFLCRTPDTLARELKLASTTIGKDTAERLLREAQDTDKLGEIQDAIAAELGRSGNTSSSTGEEENTADSWAAQPFQFFDADAEPPPLEYVWGPFAAGKVSAIVGYGYSSKTPFALDIAICIALGKAAHSQATKQKRVLYLATEGARNARRKAQRIARAHGTTLSAIADRFQIAQAPSGFLNAESVAAVLPTLAAEDVGVVFLDTYGSALDGNIDRNAAAFSDALKQLGDESDRTGIVFVVLLHTRKDKAGAGGNALQDIDGHNSAGAALQGAVRLSRPNEDDKTLIRVECIRAPDDEFEPFVIRWEDVRDPAGQPARFGSHGPDPQWGLRAAPSDGEVSARLKGRLEAQHAATLLATKAAVIAYVRANPLCTASLLAANVDAKAENIKTARIALVAAGVLIEIVDRTSQRYKLKES